MDSAPFNPRFAIDYLVAGDFGMEKHNHGNNARQIPLYRVASRRKETFTMDSSLEIAGEKRESTVCLAKFRLPISDSCKATARVTVLLPADLWFSSRERSPYVALAFEDLWYLSIPPGAICICSN